MILYSLLTSIIAFLDEIRLWDKWWMFLQELLGFDNFSPFILSTSVCDLDLWPSCAHVKNRREVDPSIQLNKSLNYLIPDFLFKKYKILFD